MNRPSLRSLTGLAFLLATFSVANCGTSDESTFPGAGTDAGGDGRDPIFGDNCSAPNVCDGGGGTSGLCGNGVINENEGCDDGNTNDGDGCNKGCNVETGYLCQNPGLKCQAAKCGDGIVAGNEECDFPPGQTITGCKADCHIADGYDCDPVTLKCAASVCGDGKITRGETCDDPNTRPFDGCYKCKKEPTCSNGVCQPSCGDGQRFASEACDDGNAKSGDGCSADCKIETGFTCTDVVAAPPPSIELPVLIRDVIGVNNEVNGGAVHPDFNELGGEGVAGITTDMLDPASGRPVYNCPGGDCTQNPGHLYVSGRPNTSTKANFDKWYRDDPLNIVSVYPITLKRKPDGTYDWDSRDTTDNGGKDFFDPVASGGWVAANKEALQCSPLRNVSFTSETHFWFEYQGGERFDFAGDDDTWVFVNGRLAIDLGGLHTPRSGFFVLDNDTDGAGPDTANGTASVTSRLDPDNPVTVTKNFALTRGGVYEVVMFQAERNECDSNFKVTLKDFNRPKSTCASKCGDGIVASDEACDDGKNDGSYGGCMPGCKARPAHCGDGKVDAPQETCDDGNPNNNDACTNQCKPPIVK